MEKKIKDTFDVGLRNSLQSSVAQEAANGLIELEKQRRNQIEQALKPIGFGVAEQLAREADELQNLIRQFSDSKQFPRLVSQISGLFRKESVSLAEEGGNEHLAEALRNFFNYLEVVREVGPEAQETDQALTASFMLGIYLTVVNLHVMSLEGGSADGLAFVDSNLAASLNSAVDEIAPKKMGSRKKPRHEGLKHAAITEATEHYSRNNYVENPRKIHYKHSFVKEFLEKHNSRVSPRSVGRWTESVVPDFAVKKGSGGPHPDYIDSATVSKHIK